MRQPLWLINASLVCIILISELIFLILQTSIPRRFSLEPGALKVQEKKIPIDVVIKQIYGDNDLFGTYVSDVPTLAKGVAQIQIPAIPEPPAPIPLDIPIEKPPVFIAPLAVTLKGVIYLQDDSEQSVAILQFKDSKKEHNYKVGEMIQDAQILKIFPSRVIVVRSNGQQEVLYLREQDLKKDFEQDDQKGIESLVVVSKNNKQHVPLEAFLKQVSSLGQFIDMLDLRTVYQKGKIVGCRVGKATKDSLGGKLGFKQDDLLKTVDNIAIVDLHSRIEIYDHVTQKKVGDEINVEVERDGKLVSITFVLSSDQQAPNTIIDVSKLKSQGIKDATEYNVEENKKKILEQRVKLAPTAHQIQMDEQRKLIEARRKNMLSDQHVPKQ